MPNSGKSYCRISVIFILIPWFIFKCQRRCQPKKQVLFVQFVSEAKILWFLFPFHIPIFVKFLTFYKPEAWERYAFWAEPPYRVHSEEKLKLGKFVNWKSKVIFVTNIFREIHRILSTGLNMSFHCGALTLR